MAGVNFKIGADASAFKQGVSEAQASLKTLDAALKVNEASFKAGGDAETYMSQKLEILNSKMTQQKNLANQLQAGLQKMRQAGVSPTSVEYQKLERDLYNAQAAMNETKVAIDNLDGSQEKATESAGNLTTAVNGISKKISLDQVIGGIDRITGAMQTAAGAAVNLGEKIWDNVMNAAKWADDSSTMALMYGIDLDTFLRMQKLVTNGMDTSVDAMLKSQTKLNKNIGDGNKDTLKYFRELGVAIATVTGESMDIVQRKNPADLFWEIGDALMAMGDAYDKEAASQAIFGRGWKELVPLFEKYDSRAEYEKALGDVKVNTEQEVNDLAELNDKVAELQGNVETLTNKGWAALAPSLTGAAEALNGLLGSVLEYLDTPEGKEALKEMSESVTTLFEDLGKIDPKEVVNNFTSVFNGMVDNFKWLAENKDGVIRALKDIVGGWAGLKLTGGALQVYQLLQNIRTLRGGDAGQAAKDVATTAIGTNAATATATAKTATQALSQNGGFSAAVANFLTGKWATGFTTMLLGIPMLDTIMNTNWIDVFRQMGNDANNLPSAVKEVASNPEQSKRSFQKLIGEAFGLDVDGGGTGGSVVDTMSEEAVKAAKKYWQVYEETGTEAAMDARDRLQRTLQDEGFYNDEQGVSLIENIFDNWLKGMDPDGMGERLKARFQDGRKKPMDLSEAWKTLTDGKSIEVPTEPEAPENAAEILRAQIGTVPVQVQPVFSGAGYGGSTGGGTMSLLRDFGNGLASLFGIHANGLWSVPFDNYPALLHRGERVVPAREVSSRSYNSNLYVEKMYMSNGTDAQGLADAMAAANRRTVNSYGGG